VRQEESRHGEHVARGWRRRNPGRGNRAAASTGAVESATRQSVRRGVIAMLVAAGVLLVFNSGGLRSWARGLPGNAATDTLVEGADRWHSIMRRAGLTKVMAAVQHAVAAFRSQGWPGTDMLAAGQSASPRRNE
jgi:hypothetical protein